MKIRHKLRERTGKAKMERGPKVGKLKSFMSELWRRALPLRRARYFIQRYVEKKLGSKPPFEHRTLLQLNPIPSWCQIVRVFWKDRGFLELALPATLGCEVDAHFLQHQQVAPFDSYLARIQGATLEGADGLLFLPDGSLLLENHFFWCDYVINQRGYYRRKRRVRFLGGPAFSLLGFSPSSYYHWMTDVLYRLERVRDALPAETRFLVSESASAAQLQALQAFQIERERLVFLEKEDHVECEDLWYSPPVMQSGFHLPEMAKATATRLRERFRHLMGKGPKRVYITRSGATRRRVINEPELIAALQSRGFVSIACESLPLEAQARAFCDAEIIIAPHGAGLTNLLFAPDSCSVLELMPSKVPRGGVCYWSMAQALGQRYTCVACRDAPSEYAEADFFVPIDLVLAWCERQ